MVVGRGESPTILLRLRVLILWYTDDRNSGPNLNIFTIFRMFVFPKPLTQSQFFSIKGHLVKTLSGLMSKWFKDTYPPVTYPLDTYPLDPYPLGHIPPRTYTPQTLKCPIVSWIMDVLITYCTLKSIHFAEIAFICDEGAIQFTDICSVRKG